MSELVSCRLADLRMCCHDTHDPPHAASPCRLLTLLHICIPPVRTACAFCNQTKPCHQTKTCHQIPKTSCRYYKDWIIDNDITFGAINSKHGVIEFVSQGENPVGLAAPALAVRGGSMLITYSYSGPFNVPSSNGGIRAYPGASEWWP